MILDEEDKGLEGHFKDLLAFYGLELQSHASLLIGLAVVIFAVVQAWGQLVSTFGSAIASSQQSATIEYGSWLFSGVVGVLGLLIVYEVIRLIVFGKLASSLISCSGTEFRWHKENYEQAVARQNVEKVREGKPPLLEWHDLSDFRKVNVYTSGAMKLGLRRLLKLGIFVITEGDDPRTATRSFWVQAVGFALSFSVSYNFLFGRFDSFVLVEQIVGSFLLLEVIHFHSWPSFRAWRDGWIFMWKGIRLLHLS